MKIATVSASDDGLPIVSASATFAIPVTSKLTICDWDTWLSEHQTLADAIKFYWTYADEPSSHAGTIDPLYYIGNIDRFYLTDFTSLRMAMLTT